MTNIIIEKANTGNQGDVELVVNGVKTPLKRGEVVTVTDEQIEALEHSHVQFEVLGSSDDGAAGIEGSVPAAEEAEPVNPAGSEPNADEQGGDAGSSETGSDESGDATLGEGSSPEAADQTSTEATTE